MAEWRTIILDTSHLSALIKGGLCPHFSEQASRNKVKVLLTIVNIRELKDMFDLSEVEHLTYFNSTFILEPGTSIESLKEQFETDLFKEIWYKQKDVSLMRGRHRSFDKIVKSIPANSPYYKQAKTAIRELEKICNSVAPPGTIQGEMTKSSKLDGGFFGDVGLLVAAKRYDVSYVFVDKDTYAQTRKLEEFPPERIIKYRPEFMGRFFEDHCHLFIEK